VCIAVLSSLFTCALAKCQGFFCCPSWIPVLVRDSECNFVVKESQADINALYHASLRFRYDVDGEPYAFFRQEKETNNDMYKLIIDTWTVRNGEYGVEIGTDYSIYDTEEDMIYKRNHWKYCPPQSMGGIGFPGTCSKTNEGPSLPYLSDCPLQVPARTQGFYICGGPTPRPSSVPTNERDTPLPTMLPTVKPSMPPSGAPTTQKPTDKPTSEPSMPPSRAPTTQMPTEKPTHPSKMPTTTKSTEPPSLLPTTAKPSTGAPTNSPIRQVRDGGGGGGGGATQPPSETPRWEQCSTIISLNRSSLSVVPETQNADGLWCHKLGEGLRISMGFDRYPSLSDIKVVALVNFDDYVKKRAPCTLDKQSKQVSCTVASEGRRALVGVEFIDETHECFITEAALRTNMAPSPESECQNPKVDGRCFVSDPGSSKLTLGFGGRLFRNAKAEAARNDHFQCLVKNQAGDVLATKAIKLGNGSFECVNNLVLKGPVQATIVTENRSQVVFDYYFMDPCDNTVVTGASHSITTSKKMENKWFIAGLSLGGVLLCTCGFCSACSSSRRRKRQYSSETSSTIGHYHGDPQYNQSSTNRPRMFIRRMSQRIFRNHTDDTNQNADLSMFDPQDFHDSVYSTSDVRHAERTEWTQNPYNNNNGQPHYQ